MRRFVPLSFVLLGLSACASGPQVRGSRDLPIKKVVLYRSGVGYFERQGSFEGDALEFAVKKREVGDFLSSLTAVERTSGGVRSISFDVPEAPPKPQCQEGEEPCPTAPDPEEQPVDVRLMLADRSQHDLNVAYVVGSPIWRPSYRVVFDKDKQALLQAWAVVQNNSGEDWRDVQLSLTTGAPISFRSDLGTPITPERPLVTDEGEVVSAVPVGETALGQEEKLAESAPVASMPPPAPPPMEMDKDMAQEEVMAAQTAAPEAAKRRRSLMRHSAEGAVGGGAGAMPAPKPVAPQMQADNIERSVTARAKAHVLSGTVTRYDIDHAVTIPNGGSTMVALVSTRVPGEKAHLFAPEGGVALSYQHPFAVARLSNKTKAVLEKGPVSVLTDGAFLGQGVLDTLPADANAFVPFAIDKSLVVETSEHYDQQQGALVRVQRGLVTIQTFSQRKSKYKLRNGSDEPTKVYVRHTRWGEAELVSPPAGTELTPGRALVPVELAKKSQRELEVLERTPAQTTLAFTDQAAADAVALYLSGAAADLPQSAALKQALSLRTDLLKVYEQITAQEREQAELQNGSEETRNNLKAIEKVNSAGDLRARLVARLKQLDARLGELTRQLVEARTKRSELEVRLNEALESVSLNVQ